MEGWGLGRGGALLLCAAGCGALSASPAAAQAVPPANAPATAPQQLDPDAPLAPMPDLGVAWPELDTKQKLPAPTAGNPGSKAPLTINSKAPKNLSADVAGTERYAVRLEGLSSLPDWELVTKEFHERSTLEAERKDPANAAQISRRAASDAELLTQLLRSQGYYDAAVEPRTQHDGNILQVILAANPGSRYRFASVSLPGLERAGTSESKLRQAFDVKTGDPVIAEDVINSAAALTRALGEEGFAEAHLGTQDIEVNHLTHLATLSLPVDLGPVARFGAIHVTGRPLFSAHHVGIIARFRPGDPFQRSKIDDLRRALIATTLVASAEIKLVPVDGGRVVDVDVHLEPAPSRTIAGDIGYGTGQGALVEATWTARNFFNPEGALILRGILGTTEQLAGVEVRRSDFLQRDQTLDLQATASHQKFDAYTARTLLLGGNIERQSNFIWQKSWTWSYGAQFIATNEHGVFSTTGVKGTRTFLIAAVPLTLGYDGSDNLLDPTRGFRLSGWISPEYSGRGSSFIYARSQVDASAYTPISTGIVLAGRLRLGSIFGASDYDIAPSRRLYSGGGGSVRGYGYQQLGPKDVDGDPIGGRGLAEFSIETRIRLKQFGGNFGIVPFLDGGSLTTDSVPDFKNWRLAAGLGVRYYSSFGPIRIDAGIPLNRQKGDGPVALTVSLGQAF